MHPLQQMRGRDVGEVERGVLAQQDHVEFGQLGPTRLAEREVIAERVAHPQRLHGGEHASADLRQAVRRVVAQAMAPRLPLQHQREGRVATDVDPLDRIHLDRNIESHRIPFCTCGIGYARHSTAD